MARDLLYHSDDISIINAMRKNIMILSKLHLHFMKVFAFVACLPICGNPTRAEKTDTITLCCISDSYFEKHFENTKTTPILQTKSMIYPASFILHDALKG